MILLRHGKAAPADQGGDHKRPLAAKGRADCPLIGAKLKQLGVSSVRLMTNNPSKIAALQNNGLDVVSDQRVLGRPTAENVRYLASKRDRAGHFIDFESMTTHAPLQD